jgi:predicted nucleotidyltransferase
VDARPAFPTPHHRDAAAEVAGFFSSRTGARAVLLVNSCARGVATAESDLDFAVLVTPELSTGERDALERRWREHYAAGEAFRRLERCGPFCRVHLDLFDGRFAAEPWDDGGGPDRFELEVGNLVAFPAPLWEGDGSFARLRAEWLPFYGEALRRERLEMVRAACAYDLDHVSFFAGRGLYFQAFDRLYKAFQEFLQALFISRRAYPLAYNKWIREQVETRLGLPELYARLPAILEVGRLESRDAARNAEALRDLLEAWIPL